MRPGGVVLGGVSDGGVSVAVDTPSAIRLLVAAEVHEIERGKGPLNVELSLATAVEEEWLNELYPEDFLEEDIVVLEEDGRRVAARRVRRFRDLVLEERPLPHPPADAAAA